ncbi:MAG: DNA recombination protein RmuC [Bifidobacteriaceae bacterium]|jgi:DNA recombination protein RmuC|nr:DNA recombination protein RmuC [Bifidobacteriaceae bacterium]
MIETWVAALIGVGCLILGLVLGWLLGRRGSSGPDPAVAQAAAVAQMEREHALQVQATAQVTEAQQQAAAQVAQAREVAAAAQATAARLAEENAELRQRAQEDQNVLKALVPVQAKIQDVAQYVAVLEKERAGQYEQLQEQLRLARQTDEHLRSSTDALAGALRSNQVRGQWGEIELRRILELSGLGRHVSFSEQVTLPAQGGEGGGRPDVVINLPGDKFLAIDAKVPMGAYLEASALAGDDPQADTRRTGLLAEHARQLRSHVDVLAKRTYWEGLTNSPEFVVMFVPTEALLSSALDTDPGLMDYALSKGVAPATPSSLLALLKTVATIWQHSTVTDQARDLLELGRTLYKRLGTLGGHVGKMGGALERTVAAYNQMVGSLERQVFSTARRFEAFDAAGLESPQLESEKIQVRQLTAPELAEIDDEAELSAGGNLLEDAPSATDGDADGAEEEEGGAEEEQGEE